MKGTSVPLRVYFSGAIMPIKKTATHYPHISQRRFTKNEAARTKQYLLCKTKPISKGLLMTVTSAITSTYEHKSPLRAPKKQSQFPQRPKTSANQSYLDTPADAAKKTNPIQTQSKPKQSQSNPIKPTNAKLSPRPPRKYFSIFMLDCPIF